MRSHVPDPRASQVGRRILAALLAAVCLVAGAGRTDAAVLEASANAAPTVNTHRCKCGMDCKGRCCCEKKAKSLTPPSKKKAPSVGASVIDAGPCMGAVPCGAGLPGLPSVVSVVKSAAIIPSLYLGVESRGSFLATGSTLLHASLVASRLDDPPERSARV
jgi:hypothetical protein